MGDYVIIYDKEKDKDTIYVKFGKVWLKCYRLQVDEMFDGKSKFVTLKRLTGYFGVKA